MTFTIGHIQGGTHAGWKRFVATPIKPWSCPCGKRPPEWRNCPDCHERRPDE